MEQSFNGAHKMHFSSYYTKNVSYSSYSDSVFINLENLSDSNEACMYDLNMTSNLNETIIESIRKPFSYEIKNRLLKRCNSLDYLNRKKNFINLAVNAPIIKIGNVFSEFNGSFIVNKEIGKGSYANIFIISNETATCALKVYMNFRNICFFYTRPRKY